MNQKSNINLFIFNTKWVIIGKVLSQLLSFVALVFVIKKIDVDIFGTFNFLLTTFLFFNIFGLSPFVSIIRRYIPELQQKMDYIGIKKFLLFSNVLSLLIFIILSTFFYLFRNKLSIFFNIPLLEIFIVPTLIYLFLHFFEIITRNTLQALLLNQKLSIITIIANFIKTVLYFIFLPKINISNLLIIEISSTSIILFFGLLSILMHIKTNINFSFPVTDKLNYKRVLRYSFFATLSEFGQGALGRSSDIFIVSAISNPVQLGLYSFGNKIYSLLGKLTPTREILTVLRPIFIKRFSLGYDNDEFKRIYNFIIKILLPFYLTPAFYFLIFGEGIVKYVFDEKYLGALFVTTILLFSKVFHGLFISQGMTIELLEKVEIKFYTQIISIFSIFLGIYGMQKYGINGLAIATSVGLASKYSIMQFFLQKHIKIKYDIKGIFKFFFIYILSYLIFYYFVRVFIVNSLFNLLLLSILYILCLCLLIYMINPYSKYEVKTFKKILNNITFFNKINRFFSKYLRINKNNLSDNEFLFISYGKSGRTWVRLFLNHYYFFCHPFSVVERNNLKYYNSIPQINFKHLVKSDKILDLNIFKRIYNENKNKKVILLFRDPRDIVISYYFQKTKRKMTKINDIHFNNISEFIRSDLFGINRIINYQNFWYKKRSQFASCHIMFYNEILNNPNEEFHKLLSYLGESDFNKSAFEKAINETNFDKMKNNEKKQLYSDFELQASDINDNNSYKVREGGIGGYLKYLNETDIEYVNEANKKLIPELQKVYKCKV